MDEPKQERLASDPMPNEEVRTNAGRGWRLHLVLTALMGSIAETHTYWIVNIGINFHS